MTPAAPTALPPVPVKKGKGCAAFGCGGCLVVLLIGIAVLAFGFFAVLSAIKSSAPYQTALTHAQNSSEVVAELGAPVEPGFMLTGTADSKNGVLTVEFTIPLKGPKGTGSVYSRGTKTGETWTQEELKATIDADGKVIELPK